MRTYELSFFNGMPLIVDEGKVILIDTGAPKTIHTEEFLVFNSRRYKCGADFMGLTVNEISEMLGRKITTLLAVDILFDYNVMFDYKNKIVEFSKHDTLPDAKEIKISTYMKIPMIDIEINRQHMKLFLDTGAKYSYLSATVTKNYDCFGIVDDFHPVIGKFNTPAYDIMTNFDNNYFNVTYGNLPRLLQMSFIMGGTYGIIGYDFFSNFKVMLDLKNDKMRYAANN